jgi:preprotein translocase subunit SecF
MEFPNIYEKNYKYYIIVPAALVIFSLLLIFFIKPLQLGIDFKSGIEIQIISSNELDINLLKSLLEKENYVVYSIQSDKSPAGYLTYIQISRSPSLVKAEELKSKFFEINKELVWLEISLNSQNPSNSSLEKYNLEREKANNYANELFKLAGLEQNASAYNSVNLLAKRVQEVFAQFSSSENNKIRNLLTTNLRLESISIKERTSVLSSDFLNKAGSVVIISIILIIIAVFLIFKTFIPSVAVISGAFADIVFALGFMSLFSIPLDLPTFATLLMLVGFSLDTDILLTMNILKRSEGSIRTRAYEAMKTGTTMSLSTIVAFLTLILIGLITKIQLYFLIGVVGFAGLIGDLIATWLFNAVILLYYLESLEKQGKSIQTKGILEILFRN